MLRQAEIRPKGDDTSGGHVHEKDDTVLSETQARFQIDGYMALIESHTVSLELVKRQYDRIIMGNCDTDELPNKTAIASLLRSLESDIGEAVRQLKQRADDLAACFADAKFKTQPEG